MRGMIDSKRQFHELPFYKIKEICEVMVNTAISEDINLKDKYEHEYKNKITRFSSDIEFVIRELGWMIYDPLCLGKDEVLFSNGIRSFIASMDYIRSINYDTNSIVNNKMGFLPLTDENLKYDERLQDTDNKDTGIVDELGFVSSSLMPSLNDLASLLLMNDLMSNKSAYEEYLEHRHEYVSSLEYVTSKPNVISIEKLTDGKFTLGFVSENDGKVEDFIKKLQDNGLIAELKPLVSNEEMKRIA